MTKIIQIILLTTFYVALSFSSYVYADARFDSEHWAGQFYESEDGRLDICVLSLHNSLDQLLLIRLDKHQILSVGVSDQSWRATTGETVRATLFIDHSRFYRGPAEAMSEDVFVMQLPQLDQALDDLSRADDVLINIKKMVLNFNLKGVGNALDWLVECVRHGADAHRTS